MPEATSPIRDITRASIAAALASLSLAMSTRAQTPVIYVDDSAPAGGDGTSWDHAFRDIQDALQSAVMFKDRVRIHVGQGTYYPDRGTLNRNATYNVPPAGVQSANTFSFVGGFAGYGAVNPDAFNPSAFVTVLSGDLKHDDKPDFVNRSDNARTIVTADTSRSIAPHIRGFRITGAHADPGDSLTGGIVSFSLTLHSVGLEIRDCVIADNEPSDFGGVVVATYQFFGLIDSTISDNRGLGIFALQTLMEVTRSKITNNTGGAIDNPGTFGNINLANSIVAGNGLPPSGENTPAVRANDVSLSNCAVLGNYCGDTPTIFAAEHFWIQSSTVAGNTSLYTVIQGGGDNSLIQDSVIWGNTSRNQLAVLFGGTRPYNLLIDHSDIQFGRAAIETTNGSEYFWGPGMIERDPKFKDPLGTDGNAATWKDNDYTPSPASPCIDAAGRYVSWYEFDVLGNPRFVEGNGDSIVAADMGAYELQGKSCSADINRDGLVDDHDFLLFWNYFDRGYDGFTDFNHDGFVTGDDWDEFIAAFVSGC